MNFASLGGLGLHSIVRYVVESYTQSVAGPMDGKPGEDSEKPGKAALQVLLVMDKVHLLPPFVASFLLTLSIVLCKAFFTGPLPKVVMS